MNQEQKSAISDFENYVSGVLGTGSIHQVLIQRQFDALKKTLTTAPVESVEPAPDTVAATPQAITAEKENENGDVP